MAHTIASHEKETIAITGKPHSSHPDTSLPTSTIFVPVVGLGHQRSRFRHELTDYLLGVDINSDDSTGVVEKIAVSSKSSIDHGADLNKRRSLQDYSTNEILPWVIVGHGPVHKNGKARDILEGLDIDTVEVVDAVVSTRVSSRSVIGNIRLGEEVGNVRGWVYDRGSDNANGVGNVSTADVRLQERVV